MRVLALDIGERRVGLALSDPDGRVALPFSVLDAECLRGDFREIAGIVQVEGVDLVLIGLPLSLDGTEGPQAALVREIGQRLARFLPVRVEYRDERFSSAEAARAARESGMSDREQRGTLDASAAAVFLQEYLDSTREEDRRDQTDQ